MNDPKQEVAQALAARYFMAQFWCEFTKDVLTEFLNEDFLIKQMQEQDLAVCQMVGVSKEDDNGLKEEVQGSKKLNQKSTAPCDPVPSYQHYSTSIN